MAQTGIASDSRNRLRTSGVVFTHTYQSVGDQDFDTTKCIHDVSKMTAPVHKRIGDGPGCWLDTEMMNDMK
jgi:hypothetical protein